MRLHFREVLLALVEYVPRRRVAIVDRVGSGPDISGGGEAVPAEYDRIVLGKKPRPEEKRELELEVAESFFKDRGRHGDESPVESQLPRIEAPRIEKPRRKVGMERLRHHRDETLAAPFVEESVMEDADAARFVLLVGHG